MNSIDGVAADHGLKITKITALTWTSGRKPVTGMMTIATLRLVSQAVPD